MTGPFPLPYTGCIVKGIEIIPLDKKAAGQGPPAKRRGKGVTPNGRSIIIGQESWEIHVVSARPGKVRGNHYHTRKWEQLRVVTGSGLLRVRNIDTGEEQDISLGENDLKAVSIAPGIAHAIKNIGSSDMVVQVYCSEKYDPADPDTVRHPILEAEYLRG